MKMYITTYKINKPKIVQFLKFKFLFKIKLNFNGGQFKKSRVKDSLQQSNMKFWLFQKNIAYSNQI